MISKKFRRTRKRALQEHNHQCAFCNISDDEHREEHGRGLDVHHIVPRSAGGSDNVSNLIPVCRSCHSQIEHTQGKGIKELKKSLKGEIKDTLESESNLEEQRNKVVIDERWERESGIAEIIDIESKQIAISDEGPEYETRVFFMYKGADDFVYIEPRQKFIQNGDRMADQYASYLQTKWCHNCDE